MNRMERSPLNHKGNRNVLCPHYSQCLDEAIARAWEFWECGSCENRLTQDLEVDIHFAANDPLLFYDLPVQFSKHF